MRFSSFQFLILASIETLAQESISALQGHRWIFTDASNHFWTKGYVEEVVKNYYPNHFLKWMNSKEEKMSKLAKKGYQTFERCGKESRLVTKKQNFNIEKLRFNFLNFQFNVNFISYEGVGERIVQKLGRNIDLMNTACHSNF